MFWASSRGLHHFFFLQFFRMLKKWHFDFSQNNFTQIGSLLYFVPKYYYDYFMCFLIYNKVVFKWALTEHLAIRSSWDMKNLADRPKWKKMLRAVELHRLSAAESKG